ncbi:hypothetical protein BJV78DRAFT_633542 [Lactifluus subvellereus]|nr:hypothetical protein BJV78DRAFT_633542 [Lactifluus subvellereus]
MDPFGYRCRLTPDLVLGILRADCAHRNFRVNYEGDAGVIAGYVFHLVEDVHYALTGKISEFTHQEHTDRSVVVTDHVCKLDGGIKILWEDKSPRVFDAFVGELMNKIREHGSGIIPYPELSPTAYRGYQAILAKLSYHSSDVQPPVRWAVLFSGLKYIIIYIPRSSGRPTFYCSPIINFCLRPDCPQEPAARPRPPIWSMLVYMLLTETLNVSDETLRQKFGLPVLSGDASSNLGT